MLRQPESVLNERGRDGCKWTLYANATSKAQLGEGDGLLDAGKRGRVFGTVSHLTYSTLVIVIIAEPSSSSLTIRRGASHFFFFFWPFACPGVLPPVLFFCPLAAPLGAPPPPPPSRLPHCSYIFGT